MDFATRLESLIGAKPLHAFSREVGIPDPTLRSCLRRRSVPRMDVVVQIAAGTGVSLEWLATGSGPKYPIEGDIRDRALQLLGDPKVTKELPAHPYLQEPVARGRRPKSGVSPGMIAALVQSLETAGLNGAVEWLLLGRKHSSRRRAESESTPTRPASLVGWIRKLKLEEDWAGRSRGYRELVGWLSTGEADVNLPGIDGVTPLMEAARGPMGEPFLVRILLEHGADIHARDDYQNTALTLAVCEQSIKLEENLPCIGVLLSHGADPLDKAYAMSLDSCLGWAKLNKMRWTQLLLEDCLRERAYKGVLGPTSPQ